MNDRLNNRSLTTTKIRNLLQEGAFEEAFTMATEPLHEALYEKQSFDLLDEQTVQERVALTFDYIQSQVAQGGFIQLIQNGYTTLILTAIEGMQEMRLNKDMISVLDDVLKVYVLNVDVLSKEVSVEEFARLYNDFKEFEVLEERFDAAKRETMQTIVEHLINVEN